MALIRYPGSKEKLSNRIWSLFPDEMRHELWMEARAHEYREPFFGAGAMGFRILAILPKRCRVWINDIDPGMHALWSAVANHHRELIRHAMRFTPSTDYFYQFKEEDGRLTGCMVRDGFRKLALHRMSYSGLGVMSGGPLGGRNQKSEYNVACRWSAERISKDITKLHSIFRRFRDLRITCGDFSPLIHDDSGESFIYADPPYYEKGGQLYKHNMNHEDHERLALLLRETKAKWVLSYDDHPAIRLLYSWATFHEIHVKYTMAKAKGVRPKNREVAITPS